MGDRPGQKEQRENISVAIRCRPASKNTTSTAWQVLPDQRKVVLTPEAHSAGTGALLSEVERGGRRVKLENFEFDRVFNEEATTRQVYQTAAQPIVLSALDGVNGSVMTYGQTGALPAAAGYMPHASWHTTHGADTDMRLACWHYCTSNNPPAASNE